MSETHESWWDAVRQLPPSHRFVAHEPETRRYARARQKLCYLLRTGVYLGATDIAGDDGRIELAIWAPPDRRRRPGYSACFRVFIEQGVATGAVLFCFYDGTESSLALSTLQEAQAYARAHGFAKETPNGTED